MIRRGLLLLALTAAACGDTARNPNGAGGAGATAGAAPGSGAASGSNSGAGAASSGSDSGAASGSDSGSGAAGAAGVAGAGGEGCVAEAVAPIACADAIEGDLQALVEVAADADYSLSAVDGVAGQSALRFHSTDAAFLVTLRFRPAEPLSAKDTDELRLLVRATNQNTGWQGNVPLVTLEDTAGHRRSYEPAAALYPTDGATWVELRVPLAGGGGFQVTGDELQLPFIAAVELTADTWEAGFTIDFDGLGFVADGTVCEVDCAEDCNGRGSCDARALGCWCEVGAEGESCAACSDGFALEDGHCVLEDDGDFDVWPNQVSSVNGDAWLRAHHQSIKTLQPRVLALNFANPSVPANVEQLVEQVIAGFREGSRPLGAEDDTAEPGLDYELVDIVDLRDGVGNRPPAPPDFPYENSTLYPRRPQNESGAWGLDYAELFTDAFAPHYGFEDPAAPGSYLNLCELIESGRIHELWLVGSGDVPDASAAEVLEWKQRYDAARNPIDGAFERCAGNGCFDVDVPHCGRSVRIGFVNYNRGPGCYLHSQGHGLEGTATHRAVPALSEWFLPFAGFDLDQRYGLPGNSFYALVGDGDSLTYPEPTTLELHRGGQTTSVSSYVAGCGNVHFPPNAGAHYDDASDVAVSSDCRDFGRNVAECRPRQSAIVNRAAWQEYEALSPDCSGAYLIWWFQHMPGFESAQRFEDGREMLSVWPFLFY